MGPASGPVASALEAQLAEDNLREVKVKLPFDQVMRLHYKIAAKELFGEFAYPLASNQKGK